MSSPGLARTLALYPDPRVFLKLPESAPEPTDLVEVLHLRAGYQDRDAERRRRATEAWTSSPAGHAQRRADAWTGLAVLGVAVGHFVLAAHW